MMDSANTDKIHQHVLYVKGRSGIVANQEGLRTIERAVVRRTPVGRRLNSNVDDPAVDPLSKEIDVWAKHPVRRRIWC